MRKKFYFNYFPPIRKFCFFAIFNFFANSFMRFFFSFQRFLAYRGDFPHLQKESYFSNFLRMFDFVLCSIWIFQHSFYTISSNFEQLQNDFFTFVKIISLQSFCPSYKFYSFWLSISGNIFQAIFSGVFFFRFFAFRNNFCTLLKIIWF